jgi:hypothetical protein
VRGGLATPGGLACALFQPHLTGFFGDNLCGLVVGERFAVPRYVLLDLRKREACQLPVGEVRATKALAKPPTCSFLYVVLAHGSPPFSIKGRPWKRIMASTWRKYPYPPRQVRHKIAGMSDATEAPAPEEPELAPALASSDQGEAEPPTTTLDTAAAEPVALAWGSSSLDDPDEPLRHPWSRTVIIAGAIIGTAAVAATVAGVVLWPESPVMSNLTSAKPNTTAQAVQPPIVATVTVPPVTLTAPPVAAPAPTTTALNDGDGMPTTKKHMSYPLVMDAAGDQRLLNSVRGKASVSDLATHYSSLVIGQAHRYCTLLNQGKTLDEADAAVEAATGWDDITTDLVMGGTDEAYSGCY